MYLDCCVALGKASTFSRSPRAECLSFDLHCDVYPKAEVSDKKERASSRVGVRYHKAQHPFPLPTQPGQSRAPMNRCPVPVFLPKSFTPRNICAGCSCAC